MVELDDKVISEQIFTEQFVCNLSKCKGACCLEGDAGAPLEIKETIILDSIYPEVKKYMRPEGILSVEMQGTHEIDPFDGDYVTPLVDGKECAYVIFEKDGTSKCAIEKAYENKAIAWKKPISCHLYPIRITEYPKFTAINYHEWSVCNDACSLGKELQVPVYKFLKEPIIRKFGEDFYRALEMIAEDISSKIE